MFSKEVIRVRISWRAWSVSSMYRANISRNSWPFKSMDSESLEDPDGVLAVVKIRSNSAANASLSAGERSILSTQSMGKGQGQNHHSTGQRELRPNVTLLCCIVEPRGKSSIGLQQHIYKSEIPPFEEMVAIPSLTPPKSKNEENFLWNPTDPMYVPQNDS